MAKKKKKKVITQIKLQIPGGSANPAPPVGPALGQHGVNIMQFCKAFNEATKQQEGVMLPVIIDVYEDKSIDFIVKSPPVSFLLKRAANLAKASSQAGKEIIAELPRSAVREIAKQKLVDLNTTDIEKAVKIVEGTARSCGIKVVEG